MVSVIRIAFAVVKLKVFKVLRTDSASIRGGFWALTPTNIVPKTETDPKFALFVQL